jgi:uncharacterized protein (TIGR03435 family)
MIMIRKLVVIASFAVGAVSLYAQTPAFEVATIKPSPPMESIAAQIMSGKVHVGMRVEGNRVDIGSMPLSSLIQAAYRVKPYQVSGPPWISGQRFDILANMPEGASHDLVPEMLQALLAERFKLTIHRETKEHSVYALVVGKGGSKLKEAAAPEADAPNPDVDKNAISLDTPGGRISFTVDAKGGGAVVNSPMTGKMRMSMGPDRTMTMEAESMTMAALAEQLSPMLDRPVLDLTELKGSYEVKLELSMDNLMQTAKGQGFQIPLPMTMPGRGRGASGPDSNTASDPGGSSIFESVQKMGLKLEPRKMPMDMIAVDSAEKTPTEN